MEVDDLFTDLADGKKLLKLLEIISGERLAKPNNGRMRVHKIENVNKSLAFLHTKVMFPRACLVFFLPSLLLFLFLSSPPASLFRDLKCVSSDIAQLSKTSRERRINRRVIGCVRSAREQLCSLRDK